MSNINIPYAGTTYNYPAIQIVSKLNSKKVVKNDKEIVKLARPNKKQI